MGGVSAEGSDIVGVRIGVLALQGAFIEHINILKQFRGVIPVEVRSKADLLDMDLEGLIIPGGESTTMGLVAERSGLLEPLREWIKKGNPVWGTCAGMIVLADKAVHTKKEGQKLFGGLDICVERNHFGSQLHSFETEISIPAIGEKPFNAIFIRAPCVVSVGSGVEVLASIDKSHNILHEEESRIVAVKQGNVMATAFHPELTNDSRLHKYFVEELVLKARN
eukprot:Nk52_evm7s805 gene=Nk52_evmTU7s805